MTIEMAHTVVNRAGQVVFDIDPRLGPTDGLSRVMDGLESVSIALAATPTSGFLWTCHEGIWRVGTVSAAHTVVGGAGAAMQVAVCPQSVAPASGTNQLTAALDLTITAPAARFGTLIASPTLLTRGDSVAFVGSGTLTGLIGNLTVNMWRVG